MLLGPCGTALHDVDLPSPAYASTGSSVLGFTAQTCPEQQQQLHRVQMLSPPMPWSEGTQVLAVILSCACCVTLSKPSKLSKDQFSPPQKALKNPSCIARGLCVPLKHLNRDITVGSSNVSQYSMEMAHLIHPGKIKQLRAVPTAPSHPVSEEGALLQKGARCCRAAMRVSSQPRKSC